ncbi:MAG: hypothetical protein O3B13_00595 [Planctomycetota bacterium]|nr:hypothetical protein [Planctomycetota bacterium]
MSDHGAKAWQWPFPMDRRKSFAANRLKIVEAAGIFPASLAPNSSGHQQEFLRRMCIGSTRQIT